MSGSNRSSISDDKMLAYIYDDVDDSDIFALEALNNGLTECDTKNQQDTDESNIKLTDILAENEQCKLLIEKLRKEKETLELRISEVYKTAKAEIARKDHRLKELNEEKNNLLFRRSNNFISKQQNNAMKRDNMEPEKEMTNEEFQKFDTTYKIPKTKHTKNPDDHQISTESKVLQDSVKEVSTHYNRTQDHSKVHQHTTTAAHSISDNNIPGSNDERKSADNMAPKHLTDINKDNARVLHDIYDSEPRNRYSRDKSRSRNKSGDRRRSPPNNLLTRRSRSLSKERLDSARNRGRSRVRQEENREELHCEKSKPRSEFNERARRSRSLSKERLSITKNRGRSRVRLEDKGSDRKEFFGHKSKPRNEFENRSRRPPRTPSGSPPRNSSASPSIEGPSQSNERKGKRISEEKIKEPNTIDCKKNHLEKEGIANEQSMRYSKVSNIRTRRKTVSSSNTEDIFDKDFVAYKDQAQLERNRRNLTKCIKDTEKDYTDEQLGSKRGNENYDIRNENSSSSKIYPKDIEYIGSSWTHREENYDTGYRSRNYNFREGPQDRDKKEYNSEHIDIRYSKPFKQQPRENYNKWHSRRSRSRSRDRGRFARSSEQDRLRREDKDRFYHSRYNESKYADWNRYRSSNINSTKRSRKYDPHVTSRDISRLKQKIIRYSLERDPKALKHAMEKRNDEKIHRRGNDTDYSDLDDLVLRLSGTSEEISSLDDAKEREDKQIYDERIDDFELVKDLGPGVLTMNNEELEKFLQWRLEELHTSNLTSKDKECYELTDIEEGQLTEPDEPDRVKESTNDIINNKIIYKEDYQANMCDIMEHSPTDIDPAKNTQNEIQHIKTHDNRLKTLFESKQTKKVLDKTTNRINNPVKESDSLLSLNEPIKAKYLEKRSKTENATEFVKEKESQNHSESKTPVDNKVRKKIGLDLYKQRKREELDSANGKTNQSEKHTMEQANKKNEKTVVKTDTNFDLTGINRNDEPFSDSKTLENTMGKSYCLELRIQARKNTDSGEFIMEDIEVDVASSAEEDGAELTIIDEEKSEKKSNNKVSVAVDENLKVSTSEETYASQEDVNETDNTCKDKNSFIHDFSMSDDDESFQNHNHPVTPINEDEHKKETKINILDITIVKQSDQNTLIDSAVRDDGNKICSIQDSQETLECVEQIQEAVQKDNTKTELTVQASTYKDKPDSKLNTEELQKCLEEGVTGSKQNSQSKHCNVNPEILHAKSTQKKDTCINSPLKAKSDKLSYEEQLESLFGTITPSPCKPSPMLLSKMQPPVPQLAKVKRNIMATSKCDKMAQNSIPTKSTSKKINFRSKSVDEALLRDKPNFGEQEHETQSKSFNTRDVNLENFQDYYPKFSNNPNYIPSLHSELYSSNQYICKKNDEYKEMKQIDGKTSDIKESKTEKVKKSEPEKKKKTKNSCIKIKMFSNTSKKRKGVDNSPETKNVKKKKLNHSCLDLSSEEELFSDSDTHSECKNSEDETKDQQKNIGKCLPKKLIKTPKINKSKRKNSAEVIDNDDKKQFSNSDLQKINNLVEEEGKKYIRDKVKKRKSMSTKKDVNSKDKEEQEKSQNDEEVKESETVLRRGMRVRKQVTFYQCTIENNYSNKDAPDLHKKKSTRRITPLKVGEVSSSKEEFTQNDGTSSIFSCERKLDDEANPNKSPKIISSSMETCNQSLLPQVEEMLTNDDGKQNKLRKLSSSAETFEKCNQSPLPHMEEMLKNLERKSSDVNDISLLDDPRPSVPSVIGQSENIPLTVDVNHSSFNESIHQINLDTKDVAMLGAFERGIFENMSDYLLDKSLPSLESVGKTKGNVCESVNKKCPKDGISQLDFSNFLNKNSTTSTPIKQTETVGVQSTTESAISIQPEPMFVSNKTPPGLSNSVSGSRNYLVNPLKRDRRKRIGIVMIDIS